MESFDQSLKHLLHNNPAAFIGFAFGGATFRLIQPVPTVLPARGRDVDGAYLIALGDTPGPDGERLVHVELYRRHQGERELGIDIAEAQVRLFRREGRLVLSHLWDLYGDADAPVREARRLVFGADGSACVYQRINLRALRAAELLDAGPPALWALVALTRDGADAPAIERARDAIEGYPGWSSTVRGDNLAVLWFVAGAEGVPRRLLEAAISREKLMENEFFRELAAEWMVEAKAQDVLAVLEARGLRVSEMIRGRILACKDLETLDAWIRRAAVAGSAAAVVRSTKARTRSEGPKAARRPRR